MKRRGQAGLYGSKITFNPQLHQQKCKNETPMINQQNTLHPKQKNVHM
jgi:hypothetical protein